MRKLHFSILVLVLVNIELVANSVATLTALQGQVDIQREQASLEATLGMKLEEKDNIQTQKNSKAQIIFSDETVITIGKNSNFSIEEYLYDENNEPVAKFNMLSGAMRTITGKIGKIAPKKFMVKTKTATIGIRGTNFTISADQSGGLEAYCTYGTITSTVNNKVYEIKQGYFISILPSGIVDIEVFTVEKLKQMRKKNFNLPKNKTKRGPTSKENHSENSAQENSAQENSEQLDSSYADNAGVVSQSVTETNSQNVLNEASTPTLDSIIAQHAMSSAVYYGSYSTTSNTGSLLNSGDTKLEINFADDTALLELGSFSNATPDVAYSFDNVNTNTIIGTQVDGNGVANGSFFGYEGNTVKGDFTYEELNKITAEGIYSTQTKQDIQ